MKLTINERIIIRSLLPFNGTMSDMYIAKNIYEKVTISNEEISSYTPTMNEFGLFYDIEGEMPKEIDIKKNEVEFLKKIIQRLSSEGKINSMMISLCIRIMNLI